MVGELIELNFCKENSQLKEIYATEFSEGSKPLKELLIFLWENNINSFACCAGHKNEDRYPYIFLDFSNFSKKQSKILLLELIASKLEFSVSLDNLNKENYRLGLSIYFDNFDVGNFIGLNDVFKFVLSDCKCGLLTRKKLSNTYKSLSQQRKFFCKI